MRLKTGAILRETRPDTIITSAWRGEARNVSAPKRERSFLAETVFIISIAQQANPNVAGQIDDFLAQLITASSLTVTTSGSDSKSVFSKPIVFVTPPVPAAVLTASCRHSLLKMRARDALTTASETLALPCSGGAFFLLHRARSFS